MVSLKKKESESLIKYYIKVTCALKWARKLLSKTETYESAKCDHWQCRCRYRTLGPKWLEDNN